MRGLGLDSACLLVRPKTSDDMGIHGLWEELSPAAERIGSPFNKYMLIKQDSLN